MIMSQESIWEDTLALNLEQIVDEITRFANYGTEATKMTELCEDAVCWKNLRDKLDSNF